MRLVQVAGFGSHYLSIFDRHNPGFTSLPFAQRREALLDDRYNATHILKPVYDKNPDCFFTVGDDAALQRAWARENGLATGDLTEILLAQIEASRAEVLYQLDPIRFPSSFVRRLPGCVKKTVAWRAALSGSADLSAYDVIVSNFETLNQAWRDRGWRSAALSPSWDPAMAPFAARTDRPVDLSFAGSYARANGHETRLGLLDAAAGLAPECTVELRLTSKPWGRLHASGWGRWIPVPFRMPARLRRIAGQPVYGREMYAGLARAKLVLNPATDIAGDVRGNMRCWEVLGCGACMLGSAGSYPEGFEAGVNFESFSGTEDLIRKVRALLADDQRRAAMATAGAQMLPRVWSKERQWDDFQALVAAL